MFTSATRNFHKLTSATKAVNIEDNSYFGFSIFDLRDWSCAQKLTKENEGTLATKPNRGLIFGGARKERRRSERRRARQISIFDFRDKG